MKNNDKQMRLFNCRDKAFFNLNVEHFIIKGNKRKRRLNKMVDYIAKIKNEYYGITKPTLLLPQMLRYLQAANMYITDNVSDCEVVSKQNALGVEVHSNEFAYSHVLPFHNGLCQQMHGHNGKIHVELNVNSFDFYKSNLPFIIDFKKFKNAIKSVIEKIDHKFIVPVDNHATYFIDKHRDEKVEIEYTTPKLKKSKLSISLENAFILPKIIARKDYNVQSTAENIVTVVYKLLAYEISKIQDFSHAFKKFELKVKYFESSRTCATKQASFNTIKS